MNFPLSPLAPENFVSRETGSAVPPLVSHSFPTFRLNLVFNPAIPHAFLDGVHIIYTVNCQRVSPELIGSSNVK